MGSLVFNQIKLVGFKSFVDPTDFLIEPGLTGVVGPNGCGKSNLLEAIRWVMGANSAKAMRASGMDDVIFNGTKTRPGRNQAHVTLTIDNRARVAPPMFNEDDTLEVTRLITKGHGSKYQVNGKTVRAKDIQLLFADASTGANSPALVRQGQINELISAKPSNRRRILEEAAGISGLHTRRHEAELRLRAAETNLSRLDDVIAQIESQLLSLRRQSRQAARYKRLASEIHEYKALLWLKRWQAALETLSAARETLQVCEAQVHNTAAVASEKTRKVVELANLLEPKREEQIIAAAVLARLNAAKDTLQQDEEAAKKEIETLSDQVEQLQSDMTREEGISADADLAIERLTRELEALNAVQDTSAAIDAASDEAEQAIKQRSALEADYNDLTRQVAEHSANQKSAERELSQAEDRLSRIERESSVANEKLAQLEAGSQSSDVQNLFTAGAKDAQEALEVARAHEQACQARRSEAEVADQLARDRLSDAKHILSSLEAEATALRKVLSRQDDDSWVPALSKIDVDKGYEHALAAALGEDLDAAVNEPANISWTGAENPGASLPNGALPLLGHVRAPIEMRARLSQIGVVSESAIDEMKHSLLPGQRLVTREGHVVRWDGLEVQADAETSAAIRLRQQTRLAELTEEVSLQQTNVDAAMSEFETARALRQEADQAMKAARQTIPDLERKDRAAQAALTQYETDLARETAEKRALQDRIERLGRELAEARKQAQQAKSSLAELLAVEDQSVRQHALSDKLRDARHAADEATATYRTLKNEADAREKRLGSVQTELADWTKRKEQAVNRISTLARRLEITSTAHQSATSGPDQFEGRRQKLFAELEAAEARRTSAADMLAQAEAALKAAESEAREAEGAHGKAREQRAAAEARLTAAQERIEDTQARIAETLNCEPEALPQYLGELPADSGLAESDIERKLERLQNERERMGGVNLRADVEAAEQEERLTAMNDERQDLIKAIARLREGIDELNSEGRERLLKAFDVVNGHFGRLFTKLFGGGEASLALTESDDPLEAGLEIMVSPPGKKLGSMSLMSGGEQALTATALIFAVFLSNPAPICVLDEVDAPLDDANVARYCNMLDAMTEQTKTKFIAITHNAVTMSRMNRLFGVTMAEQGVSQLISMELSTAERLVAAE